MRNKNQNQVVLGAGITLILVAVLSIWRAAANNVMNVAAEPVVIVDTSTQDPAKPLPQPTVAAPKAQVPKPAQVPTEYPEFRSFLDKSYTQLVLSRDMKVGTRANHDTPAETYADSENFGRIMDEVKANPALASEAMDFYERCALNADVIAPTRAVCLSHLMYWSTKKSVPFNRERFPAELIATAERLPVLWDIQ